MTLKKLAAIAALGFALTAAAVSPAFAEDATAEPAPTTAPSIECPHNTVPGWLDENGNPTSCVGDAPCPETETGDCPSDVPVAPTPSAIPVAPVVEVAPVPSVTPETVPVVVPPVVTNEAPAATEPELAETGTDGGLLAGMLAGGVSLVAGGIALVRRFA